MYPLLQWTQALVQPSILHSASKMTDALKDLCLTTCASDAATALVGIHKQLAEIGVGGTWGLAGYERLKVHGSKTGCAP